MGVHQIRRPTMPRSPAVSWLKPARLPPARPAFLAGFLYTGRILVHRSSTPGPNLFLVGAMKCGTTSMYEYLRFHPQVYFPGAGDRSGNTDFRLKEPHHFCPDRHLPARVCVKSNDEYLAMYAGGGDYAYRGDASASYLYSEAAPRLIKEFAQDARILIMLRPPLETMHSMHRALLGWLEDIPDFHEAVAASEDRRNGRRIPPGCEEWTWLDYKGSVKFAPQVERYFDTFGRDVVKVVLLEDLVGNPEKTWLAIVDFLGIDRAYQPDFRVHNPTHRHGKLESAIESIYKHPAVYKVAHAVIPYTLVRAGLSAIRKVDRGHPATDARDQALRESCRPDIESLSELLGRDLSHWF